MSAIRFDAVSRRFDGGGFGVRELSFAAPAGALTTVLGPSGCGKSTVLRLVAGLDAPSNGRIFIDGRDVTSLAPSERNVGVVFQNYALFPHLDVLGNVCFGLRMSGVAESLAGERARAALALVGLEGMAHRATFELSGGQQQRVAIARAIVTQPGVLLFDEPLSNLDARLRRQMREEIRALQQRLGLTVLYVTHDQAEAMAVSDRLMVMLDGRIQQSGTPEEIYSAPRGDFVATFMGDAIVLEAAAAADGSIALGPLRLRLGGDHGAGPVQLLIRPEAWCIAPASCTGLAGKVLRRAYLGRGAEYHIDTELGELLVTAPAAGALLQIGSPVSLSLQSRGVSVRQA